MQIRVSRLSDRGDLVACEELQRAVLGDRARTVFTVPALSAVVRSGGAVLGAQDASNGEGAALHGALIDLYATVEGYCARRTVFLGVRPEARRHGVARALRLRQRKGCQQETVDLVTWDLDPLRSDESHIAFNRLGAIATGYSRHLYGEVHDRPNVGLATDRLHIEWWVDAPRVQSLLDRGNPPAHVRLGIHQMDVLTETRLQSTGFRTITGHRDAPRAENVLVEVPVDLDPIRTEDPAAARTWRLQCRSVFELLFERGYVGIGFVHEGGRSFHLYRKADRGTVLRDT